MGSIKQLFGFCKPEYIILEFAVIHLYLLHSNSTLFEQRIDSIWQKKIGDGKIESQKSLIILQLCQNIFHHMPVNIGQSVPSALVFKGKPFVIHS